MELVKRLQVQLFRWHSDGSAPFRLGQRRIFILPSRHGLLFAATLVVMLLTAINYDLALGHTLVFLLAGLGLTGMIHGFRNLYGLTIAPGRAEPVFVGEVAHFPLTLANDRDDPRLALELEAEKGKIATAAVHGQKSTKTEVPLGATKRGWLTLPRVRLSSRYPLGLFTAWSYLQPEMRCLIYPKPLTTPLPAPTPSAQEGGSGRGGQDDFGGFRQRQPADSLHHVAWKASARQTSDQPLLVKQFTGGETTELLLDWSLTDPALELEGRLSQLAGWVLAAEGSRQDYGLDLPGRQIAPAHGPAHCQQCLEALALCEP